MTSPTLIVAECTRKLMHLLQASVLAQPLLANRIPVNLPCIRDRSLRAEFTIQTKSANSNTYHEYRLRRNYADRVGEIRLNERSSYSNGTREASPHLRKSVGLVQRLPLGRRTSPTLNFWETYHKQEERRDFGLFQFK